MTTAPTLLRQRILIPNFLPARLNELLAGRWKAAKLKKRDREMIANYAFAGGLAPAACKRKVTLRITLAPRQRGGDVDAYWKSTLDALVMCGMLVDDNTRWSEIAPVEYLRGPVKLTEIILEDLP